ncbi:MAG: histidine kinase [Burkholderiales bacterium]|jgi:transcriptional regulator of acetoin/glycerol metabolism|nr:histidine kinase [Burkholderiales bacterium]
MHTALQQSPPERTTLIAQARHALLDGASPACAPSWMEPWIERSWRRCLADGRHPSTALSFDSISTQAMRRVAESSRPLVLASRPTLEKLARAIAGTRYFAILTDAQGVVIDTHGAIDRADRRAAVIARVGADLSERAVGTTAIGAALTELQPVWLHRGEHFFDDTSIYSCAGAPLFGPDGECVGMLDLTGVEVAERPELKHLVAQSARAIENSLLLSRPHALALRMNWPGRELGTDTDGLALLDEDGVVVGTNSVARQLLPRPATRQHAALHCSDLFALPWQMLFDTARRDQPPQDLPLWSGLRLAVQPVSAQRRPTPAASRAMPLRDVEVQLIRRAVDDARGNVAEAARVLGISRATVYRKLGRRAR